MKRLAVLIVSLVYPVCVWADTQPRIRRYQNPFGWSGSAAPDLTSAGTVTGTDVAFSSLVSCEVIKTDANGNFSCGTASGTGTVTSLSQGTNMSFSVNPITSTGTINLAVPVALANGGTNQTTWTASRCVQVNAGGTALESASAACGSGSGNSFETIDVPAGTDPVADSATDTLTITETGALVITGTAATDTIDITFAANGLGTAEIDETAAYVFSALGATASTVSVTSPIFASNNADPADGGIVRLGNNENLAWEKAATGTDWTLGVNASDILASSAPVQFGTYLKSDNADTADAGAVRLGNAEALAWEASPAGTDCTLLTDASEVLTSSCGFTATGGLTIDATTESNIESAADIGGEVTSTGMASTVIADNVTVTGWVLGASTATTPSAEDNDTSLATTAYVQTELGNEVHTESKTFENLVGTDDNMLVFNFKSAATVVAIACRDSGFTTHPVIQFEDDSGNTIGAPTAVTCDATSGTAWTAVSSNNAFVAGEAIRFDNTATSAPVTGTQTMVSIAYTGGQ